MGYRLYIGEIPKKGMRKYRKMSEEELALAFREVDDESKPFFSVVNFPYLTELYELGKYVDFSSGKKYKNFFSFEQGDHEMIVVDKEFLAAIIEDYRSAVCEMFTKQNDLLNKVLQNNKKMVDVTGALAFILNEETAETPEYTAEDSETLMGLRHRLGMGSFEWGITSEGRVQMYDLEGLRGHEPMNTSWRTEYAIFNLIYIYKTFDFKKNYLIYYGH